MVHSLRTPRGRLCLALTLTSLWPLLARAGEPSASPSASLGDTVEFDARFLAGGSGRAMDLRRFSKANALSPGLYRADVTLNDTRLGSFDVRLAGDDGQAYACIDDALVRRLGLDPSKATDALRRVLARPSGEIPADTPSCRPIGDVATGATARFDATEQRLDLSIPQIHLSRSARGYVPPERWEDGIDAGLLAYQYSDFHVSGPSGDTSQRFLGLRAGVNFQGWRLRHDGSFSSSGNERRYQAIATNVQKDITPWLSTLTIGDGNTDGQLFDSIGFRGVQVASDDRMLPDSMRGYAPVVRGEARTNARVSIRQNGVVLYETVVPPGPFAITDLFAMGSGSDLEVTITEADGSRRVTTVPFSPLPQLLRQGARRYGVTIGTLRDAAAPTGTPMLQGTLQQGLNNTITTELGLQLMPRYAALLAGGAFNTPVGAFALDATLSRFDVPALGTRHGASVRASYSKFLPATLTNFLFAAYRQSTENYYSLRDAMLAERLADGAITGTSGRSRQRAVLSVTQGLGASTSLALTGTSQSYWNRTGHDRSFQLSVSRRIGTASLAFTLARSLPSPGAVPGTRGSLTLTVPLGEASTWTASAQVNNDRGTGTTSQAGLSGTLGDEHQYSVNVGTGRNREGSTFSAGGGYRGSAVMLNGSASRAPGFTQWSVSAQGGVVVHPGGVVLSNSLGEAVGLVHAPSAPGAAVVGVPGSELNGDGYAVIPYLSPYSLNNIELDMKNAPVDAVLDTTVEQAVPRAGSVVLVDFKGRRGRNVLIQAHADDGGTLPFSATVTDESGRAVGLVGQGGRIEANVESDSGRLTVRWGDDALDRCTLAYRLPPVNGKTASFARTEGTCVRPAHDLQIGKHQEP